MNIERMQKINEMAKQLVDKGVYEDLTEATRQAEIMINKGDSSISSVFGTEKEHEEENKPAPSQEDDIRIELRKVTYQVNEQSKIISELKNQINSLLSDIEKMKTSKPEPVKQNHILEKPAEQEQTTLSKESTEKEPHAKVGNYTPDNVSVEQFFYSGPPKD